MKFFATFVPRAPQILPYMIINTLCVSMTNIRPMKANEFQTVAKLIFEATNTWYLNNGKSAVFSCSPDDLTFFCETYETLDPGCCLIAEIEGKIGACCFYHPRPTHFSLGIMCVHPDFYGKRLARLLLEKIIGKAKKAELPLNLISSAQNIDSFSLYNKAGFIPMNVYQDMIIQVPEQGLTFESDELQNVRPAGLNDLKALLELEMSVSGQDHSKDLKHIISSNSSIWNCHLIEKNSKILGFLCSVNHPSSKIIGLGAAYSSIDMIPLIKSHLNFYNGSSPLLLIPSKEKNLVEAMLKLKARNIEIHLTQSLNCSAQMELNGVMLPTFMPE